MRSLASKPFSAPGILQPQQRLSRSRSTRPVEERHVLRSSRTLFLSSVHPNGLRFPWTLGTLFPGDIQTSPRQEQKQAPALLGTMFPGNQTTQTHTWTQNLSKPNVHSESTIVIESGQPQRPRHPPQRLATAIYFPATSHQRHDRTRDRPPTKRLLS